MRNPDQKSDPFAAPPPRIDGATRDEALVDRLVKLADSGPEIPADGADRIRAAIRSDWQREVRARLRRRFLWGSGSLAAAAAAVFAIAMVLIGDRTTPVVAGPAGRLLQVLGTVELVAPTGARVQLEEGDTGMEIADGSRLETGPSGRVSLALGRGESLRIDTRSALMLESATVIGLDQGGLYIDSEDEHAEGIEVRTSFGVAREIGTQFEVRREDDSLTVRVREGRVALSRDAEELEITQGTAVAILADGDRSFTSMASYAPEWEWVQAVAPAFEMEGRTAAELLDWVSRETGLWISFASPGVEDAARNAVLYGSLEGVSPAEAAALVLPGCGLEVAHGTGTLTIDFLSTGV